MSSNPRDAITSALNVVDRHPTSSGALDFFTVLDHSGAALSVDTWGRPTKNWSWFGRGEIKRTWDGEWDERVMAGIRGRW